MKKKDTWKPQELVEKVKIYQYQDFSFAYKYYENPGKKTMVLFSGFCGNIIMLDYFAEYLKNDYSVIIVEYPGHGYSPQYIGFNVDVYTDAVIQLLDSLNINDFFLVGYSFGGVNALKLYEKIQKRVNKLVLYHTTPYFCKTVDKKIMFRLYELVLKINFKFLLINISVPILKDQYFDKEMLIEAEKIIMCNHIPSVIDNYHETIYKNYEYLLKKINCPTLVIGSNQDILVSAGTSKFIHKNINNSELIIYKDCGHLSIVSRSEAVAQDVLKFIKK